MPEARDPLHLREAQVVIGAWRDHYNRVRPHSSLSYRRPPL
ncbi:transposase [Microvirga aerilata]|uniref:Transposase n=1 Tax=Microvirga aerilata TaxID=670292 RepID=A0A937D4G6_9HYPH|nr:transposase [Microvirga aerilata]